ncbi:MAG: N-acetyltransferase, partial [Ruminiclostridium sp.]|nr:N-acetyltransferase [Ruminiclostridium sp.]
MIRAYVPKPEDLWFRQVLLADPETMTYNHAWGGTIPFPKEKWNGWYDTWIVHTEEKRFYRYLVNDENEFVGEIAYHYDEAR